MTEEQVKEYIVNGGKLFTIKSIDTIRDGGTKVLDTTGGKFYIHKDTHQVMKSEDDVKWNKNLLLEIQNKK